MEKSRKRIAWIAILILVMSIALLAVGCDKKPSHESTSIKVTVKNVDPLNSWSSINITVIDGKMSYIPDTDISGYTYIGMFSQANEQYFDSNGAPLLKITEEITLYCKWKASSYPIEFYNGETLVEAATYDYDSVDTYVPIAPDKEGYDFVGWGITPNSTPMILLSQSGKAFNKQNFPTFNFKTTKVAKLRAVYHIKTYKVNFIFSIDDHVEKSAVHGGKMPQAPTREFVGKKVIGWSIDENGTTQFNDIITSDITLYPIFAFVYTISFETNKGDQLAPISEIEGKNVTLPIPTREHYTFLGWYANSSLTGTIFDSVTIGENRKFYADWDTNKYTITYHTGSAQIADAKVYTVEDIKVPLATLVDESRKSFKGWSPVENDKTIVLKELNTNTYCRNIDLYAVWTGEPVTLTLVCDGSANTTQVIEYGNAFTLPTPTKKGYTFKGWQTTANKFVTNENGESIPSWTHTESAVTLTAKFEINRYKIAIESNAIFGKVTGAGEYDFGAVVSIIIQPNAGYILKGAYCGEVLLSDKTTFDITLDDKDISINLVWFVEKESVIVTSKYNELDASTKCVVSGEGEYKTGAKVTLSILPQKEYMLDGWYVNDVKVSSDYTYTFTKSDTKTLVIVKIVDNNGVTKFISTKSDLALLNDNAGKTFILLNDIDFQYDLWATIENFEGNFYGGGHTIKNFSISNVAERVAMFGRNKGLIRDLTVENVTVSFLKVGGNVNVGVLCGVNEATGVIDNCVVK
ncbi:MAG: InlB B-repeat-containing protein, partial [Clostridia bacterium]